MNIQQSLRQLLDALPLHAEEGPAREVVPESQMLKQLGLGHDEGASVVALKVVRSLFEAIAVLDRGLLASGQWAFVSFPASLAARSLLETLSTPGQTLVEPHYWEQGAHRPAEVLEEQRRFLHELEVRRERFNPDGTAGPIRTVHVAWGVVKIQDRFLMIHREDKRRPSVANFVFPGGRLNLIDLSD